MNTRSSTISAAVMATLLLCACGEGDETSGVTASTTGDTSAGGASSNGTGATTGATTGSTTAPTPCEGVTCPEGERCVEGMCVAVDPCEGVTCDPGASCVDGQCVTPARCADVDCDGDEVCDPDTGACVPTDRCAGVECDDGLVCVEGACVTDPDCDGVECGDGEVCVGGACVEVDPCGEVTCDDDEVCAEGVCVPIDLCEGVTCELGEQCAPETGECVSAPCEDSDDAPGEATALEARSQSLNGRICAGDEDWFTVTLEAGAAALVTVTHAQDSGPLRLAVTAPGGEQEQATSEAEGGRARVALPAQDAEATWGFVVSGGSPGAEASYTLELTRDPANAPCNDTLECSGEQECDLRERVCALDCATSAECQAGESCEGGLCVLGACATDPGEPNDTPETATPTAPGALSGLALCDDEEDWFAVEVEAGQVVYALLEADPLRGDLDLELYAPAGAEPTARSATALRREVVVATAATAGTWRVRVLSAFGLQVPYTLTLALDPEGLCDGGSCGDGERCLSDGRCHPAGSCLERADCGAEAPFCAAEGFCVACMDDALEPNSREQPHVLEALAPEAPLNTCGGDDYYSFVAGPNQTMDIYVTFEHDAGDLDVALIDPSGAPVAWSDEVFDNERVTHETGDVEGTWVIWVYGLLGAINTYQLDVTLE